MSDTEVTALPPLATGRSRAEFVYLTLRDQIKNGQYVRGERIREEEVARSLGVSRTPVREALARLQARGMLEAASGGLVIVELNRSQIVELYDMREVLEGSAARFAAQHASASDIAALNRINEAFANALGDPKRQAKINREFHETINEAAHNSYLIRMLQELHDSLAVLPSTTFTVKGRGESAITEHKLIIDAIGRNDPDSAEAHARQHIRHAQMARIDMLFASR